MKPSETASRVNPAYLPTQELWLALQPLLPAEKPKDRGGRCRVDDYKLFQAMFYVLRTGIQWKALPRQLAASSTTHDRYQCLLHGIEWVKAGVFAE